MNQTNVNYLAELTVKFYCPMRFQKYPLDHQFCLFQLGSFIHNDSAMNFYLKRLSFQNSTQFKQNSVVLDYDISIFNLSEENRNHYHPVYGNYTLTGFEMKMQRKISKYVINYYIPSGIFVIVSWVSHSLIRGVLIQSCSARAKNSPIMYFVIHNSVVLSKILKIVVPF